MKEIKFAHIAPTSLVDVGIANSDFNMVLAHIADHNDKYCEAFKNSDNETLLDNGAFELGKPYSVDKMVEIGHRVGADILVLPDYPRRAYTKGWEDINHRIKVFKDAGFKTMFVPQSVDGEWFKANLGKLPNVQIVDVRGKEEFKTGALHGAINIQAEELDAKELYAKLPKDKTIVFNCSAGARSMEAWMKLDDAKIDVSKIFYFDANINCADGKCKIEVNEPLG